MKTILLLIALIISGQTLFAQDKNSHDKPVQTISFPMNSIKKEVAGPYIVENFEFPIQIILRYKEYQNLSLTDSVITSSFFLPGGERSKFEITFSHVADKILVGLERRNEPESGTILSPVETEILKVRLFPTGTLKVGKEIPVALIYADPVLDKSLTHIAAKS